jgi:hypothetical protein
LLRLLTAAYGTSPTSRDVRLESAKRAKAEIDLIAVTNRDFMGTRPGLAAVFSSLIKHDHGCRRASHSARDFGYLKIICCKRHEVLSDPRLRARLREPDASFGQITMVFAVQHALHNGRGTRLHQLGTISTVYISLTVPAARPLSRGHKSTNPYAEEQEDWVRWTVLCKGTCLLRYR